MLLAIFKKNNKHQINTMIARMWHGWTTHENADAYEDILNNKVIPGISEMNMSGFSGMQVFKRIHSEEIEFITIMRFESLEHIKQFVGEDYEEVHVPEMARAVLKRFDLRAQHYEITNEYTFDF